MVDWELYVVGGWTIVVTLLTLHEMRSTGAELHTLQRALEGLSAAKGKFDLDDAAVRAVMASVKRETHRTAKDAAEVMDLAAQKVRRLADEEKNCGKRSRSRRDEGSEGDCAEERDELEDVPMLRCATELLSCRLEDIDNKVATAKASAWESGIKGRIVKLVGQTTPFALESQHSEKMRFLQDKIEELNERWGRWFDQRTGNRPIYRPMFAEDAIEHPSCKEGRKLHEKFNN